MRNADDIMLEYMNEQFPIMVYRDSLAWDDHVDPWSPPATIDTIHVLPWANRAEVIS